MKLINGSQAQKHHKELLLEFWKYFLDDSSISGGNKMKREALKGNINGGVRTSNERLKILTDYSQIVINYSSETYKKRVDFNQVKETLHKSSKSINRKCFVCLGQAHCRHHIIQLKNGGMNDKKNLVSLCNSCHANIHPWLQNTSGSGGRLQDIVRPYRPTMP